MSLRAARGRAAAAVLAVTLASLPPAPPPPPPPPPAPPGGEPGSDGAARSDGGGRTAPGPLATQVPPEPLAIDEVSPGLLEPGDDLTLTITLTPETDIEEGRLDVAMNPAIPISRSVLAQWQSGEDASGYPVLASHELDEPLEAGESVTVEIEVSADELGLDAGRHEWGPRGVEVLLGDAGQVVEVERTVVVWGSPAESLEPLPVGLVVPATTASLCLDDAVPGLAPGGSSSDDAVLALADAVTGTGATLALDPLLLDGASPVTDTSLVDLAAADQLLALPVGDADLAALAHLDRPDLARRLTEDAVDRIGVLTGHVVPGLAWPATDQPDTEVVALAHDGASSVTMLPGAALPTAEELTYTVAGRADVDLPDPRSVRAPVLLTEERASTLLGGELHSWSGDGSTDLTDVQARQLLLADLAVVFRERPSDPRPLVLSYDRDDVLDPGAVAAVAGALSDAAWVDLTSLGALMLTPARPADRVTLPEREVTAEEVTAAGVGLAEETERLAGVVGTMTTEPPATVAGAALAVRTTVSARWRGRQAAREDLVRGWRDELTAATSAVQATPTSPINLIASAAELPVRVTNDGAFDATVTVVVDPDDPRLEAPEAVSVVVPAGGQETAHVPVSAIGSGDLPVEVRLETPEGEQIGGSATIVVRVRAGWEGVAVTVAGVALALLVVVGLARRIRDGVRVPTGDRTPVIAGDPGAPTVHVTGEQPVVVDDGSPPGTGPGPAGDDPAPEQPTTDDPADGHPPADENAADQNATDDKDER